VAAMPMHATHGVDQIGTPESIERVCAVSGRAHRRRTYLRVGLEAGGVP
jgi:hypothetical protein